MINDGLDNEGSGPGGGNFDKTYFPRDIQDSAYVCYILGGGSADLSEWYVFNGQVLATDSANASDGTSWDTDWIHIPLYAVVPEPGEIESSTYVNEVADSLHWVAAVNVGLLLPAGISEGQTTPTKWGLGQAIPNPTGTDAVLRFDVPMGGGSVRLAVYDANGRLVRVLADRTFDPGRNLTHWNGRNDSGSPVAPGVYFVRMETERFNAQRKVVLLK
jgi:hypothetical protein